MGIRDSRNRQWLYPQRRRRASAMRRDANIGKNSASRALLEDAYLPKTYAPYVDVTAPVLFAQSVFQASSTSGTPKVTTNEGNGTLYMVCVANGDTPSVAQIKAGQNSSGTAAINAQNIAVSSTGEKSFSTVTGLTTSTPYDFWFVHTDAASNNSNAVKADFTPSNTVSLTYNGLATINSSSGSSGDYTHTLFSITSVTDRYYILYLSVGVINGQPTTAVPNNTLGIDWQFGGGANDTTMQMFIGKCSSGATGNVTVNVTSAPASCDFSGGIVEVYDAGGLPLSVVQTSTPVFDTTSPLSGVSLAAFYAASNNTLLHVWAPDGGLTTTGWTTHSSTNLFNGGPHQLLGKTSEDNAPSITFTTTNGALAVAYELGYVPPPPPTAVVYSSSSTSTVSYALQLQNTVAYTSPSTTSFTYVPTYQANKTYVSASSLAVAYLRTALANETYSNVSTSTVSYAPIFAKQVTYTSTVTSATTYSASYTAAKAYTSSSASTVTYVPSYSTNPTYSSATTSTIAYTLAVTATTAYSSVATSAVNYAITATGGSGDIAYSVTGVSTISYLVAGSTTEQYAASSTSTTAYTLVLTTATPYGAVTSSAVNYALTYDGLPVDTPIRPDPSRGGKGVRFGTTRVTQYTPAETVEEVIAAVVEEVSLKTETDPAKVQMLVSGLVPDISPFLADLAALKAALLAQAQQELAARRVQEEEEMALLMLLTQQAQRRVRPWQRR